MPGFKPEVREKEVVRIKLKDGSPEFYLYVEQTGLGVDVVTLEADTMYGGLESTPAWTPLVGEDGKAKPHLVMRHDCEVFEPQDMCLTLAQEGSGTALQLERKGWLVDRLKAHWALHQNGEWN